MTETFTPYIARGRRFRDDRFDFWITDDTGRSWYDSSPDQYMTERDWCRRHIRAGFNVVDCGAHHGMVSVLFGLWVGSAGQVLAYEALPSNAAVVAKNAALNGLKNITVRPVGVGERRERVSVALNEGNTVVADGRTDLVIDVVSLDDDVPDDLRVDFLKMDVEGFELQALRGARGLLRQRPIVVLELHSFMFRDRKRQLARILSELSCSEWTFEVLGNILDVNHRGFDGPIDLNWLASFDNPHVFCTPRSMSRPLFRMFNSEYSIIQTLCRRLGIALGVISPSLNLGAPEMGHSEMLKAAQLAVFGLSELPNARSGSLKSGLHQTMAAYVELSDFSKDDSNVSMIVRTVYCNLFERSPEPEGEAYWGETLQSRLDALGDLNQRSAAIAGVLLAIIAAATPSDRQIMKARLLRL